MSISTILEAFVLLIFLQFNSFPMRLLSWKSPNTFFFLIPTLNTLQAKLHSRQGIWVCTQLTRFENRGKMKK